MLYTLSFTIVDDDTGNYITYFTRRGRPYLYMRDKLKRFMRKLDFIEVRAYVETRYSREEAKRRNPIFAATVAMALAKPGDVMKYGMEHIRAKVMERAWDFHEYLFGRRIRSISYEKGWEHGSERKGDEKQEEVYLHSIWCRTLADLEAGVGREESDVQPFSYEW